MRRGYQTTEFWAMVGAILLDLSPMIDLPGWAAPVATSVYIFGRSLLKIFR